VPVKPCPRPRASRRSWSSFASTWKTPLNEALDAAHALRLIGYALREVGNERDARAVAATAWFACQRLEALQRKWQDLFRATARAAHKSV
jgi:hypothetical protein